MQMKQYLIDTFRHNNSANRLVLESMAELPEKGEAINVFCHIINSQNKWLDRLEQYPNDTKRDWSLPVYTVVEMGQEIDESTAAWIAFLEGKTDDELLEEVKFIGFDGGHWTCVLQDIALQLNYHSIHHAAQIQLLIRQQGLTPKFVDYIGTKYRKINVE